MKNINTKETLTQHFIELSEKIKECKDFEKSYRLTKLLLEIYDRLQEQDYKVTI